MTNKLLIKNPQVVLFNGPPRSGKDTATEIAYKLVRNNYPINPVCIKFAQPLKEAVHAMLGIHVPYDHFEQNKDNPLPQFLGFTPRQSYIDFSENYIKPRFGKEYFGKVMVNRMNAIIEESDRNSIVFISDCGFAEEIEPLLDRFGAHRLNLIELYREGRDFGNDSRSYISDKVHPDIFRRSIHNNGSRKDLENKINPIIKHIIEK